MVHPKRPIISTLETIPHIRIATVHWYLFLYMEALIYRSLVAQPRRGEPVDLSKTTKAALRAMSP